MGTGTVRDFDFVFEVASEAGRKVGGIYTVLRTKSRSAVNAFGEDKYYLFGFYDERSAKEELSEEVPPASLSEIFESLRKEGIKCHYGRWKEGSFARLILVDPWEYGRNPVEVPYNSGTDARMNKIKHDLWKSWGIDSINMSPDFGENSLWATAVGILIERMLSVEPFRGKRVIGQFHEWISGAGLLYLKEKNAPIATVFTTHATVLGRSKTTFGENLARTVETALKGKITASPEEAYRFKLEGKHLMEVACSKNAEAFTTVSDTVASEVEYILGKKPDVVTLNGIDFAGEEERPDTRAANREEIENLVHAMFLPQGQVEAARALFVYLTSRYEFENKGIDFFIDALGALNRRLAGKKDSREIVGFIYVPSSIVKANETVVKNLMIIDRMREYFSEVSEGERASLEKIIEKSRADPKKFGEILKLEKNLTRFQVPPVGCFDLAYPGDVILRRIAAAGLSNSADSRVKVIFYPTYIKPGDGLLNLEYKEVMEGSDVGVFPSRYEPFGYTPAEAASESNIAITADYSGFGKFIEEHFGDTSKRGVKVIATAGKTDPEIVEKLASFIEGLATATDAELQVLRRDAKEMIRSLDWDTQISNYLAAYSLAARKKFGGG